MMQETQNATEFWAESTVVISHLSSENGEISASECLYQSEQTTILGEVGAHSLVMCLNPCDFEIVYGENDVETIGLEKDDFLFISGADPLAIRIPKGASIRHFTIQTSAPQYCIAVLEPALNNDFDEFSGMVFRSSFVAAICNDLFRRKSWTSTSNREYASVLANIIAIEIWRVGNGFVEQDSVGSMANLNGYLYEIDKAIDGQIGTKITISSIAKEIGATETHVREEIRSKSGQTAYQYFVHRRLKYAYQMVISTQLSLSEIAYLSGFSSQSHMTAAFRAKFGNSPGKIRQELD